MGTYHLPKIIRLYNDQYPGIDIDLRLGNSNYVLGKILEGAVDIGIAGKIRNHPKLSEHFIHRERLLPVCSPQHELAKKQSVGLNELAKMPFISREKGTLNRLTVEKWFKKNLGKNYPKIAIELENVEAAKQIVQQGYGYTIIPESTVNREIEMGLLKQLNIQDLDLYIQIYVVYLKGKVLPTAVKSFLEILAGSHIFSNAEDLLDRIFSG
jgi:DNA-binding transcriptional LysR family regulator